jgi:chromosome segregation protein
MDQGAHFHCCDLQVHTPRDLNWVGACPTTDAERRTFAQEFIAACRSKGLSAVAITDHHDVAFLPYIREAADQEVDENQDRFAPGKRIVVFPGIELTLAVPCQALLLFDPDVRDEDLGRALAAVGITPAAPGAAKTNPVQRLTITDLNEVSQRLAEHEGLKGRFILLPNVNDGGDDTILRTGFFEHYKQMVCVGGYVDGSFTNHGRRQILDGRDPQWGSKRCGVLQTSDARNRDFSTLANHPTWIKWSSPSTEALRQACLAPGSRIRYESPLLPGNWVSRIEVSDSRYFGPFSADFNLQLNTIIGGRGSGKSTVLEYLRWALCDQGYVHHEDDGTELPDYEKRRRQLVSSTLKPRFGTVTVHYVRNGVPHRIRRDGTTGKVFLKVADQAEQETSEEVVQSLAQIQGYSQKQLSNVSVRTQEVARLLTTPISQELSNTDAEITTEVSNLRQAFERVEVHRSIQGQLQTINLDLASKQEQLRALSAEVSDLPQEQRNEIDAHPAFVAGERLVGTFRASIDSAAEVVTQARSTIERLSADSPDVATARPPEHLESIQEAILATFARAMTQLDAINQSVTELRAEIQPSIEQVELAVANHRERYAAAASENTVVQDRLESLRTLSDQIATAEQDRDSLLLRIREIGDADQVLRDVRQRWVVAINRKIGIMQAQATQLSGGPGSVLRVRVENFNDLEPLRAALQSAVMGAGITRPEKFESLIEQISLSPDRLRAWLELGDELISLARTGPLLATGAELPRTPKLTGAGFIAAELRRIATRLNTNAAFQITLLCPSTVPLFEYLTAGGSYVPFQDASPGQQATALIGLLLNQSVGPLVVDQPEDDLDNTTILDVADRLTKAKERRQIIFSTHNPNLVVVGDSELVLHCAYRQPTLMARIHIADQGAIDNRSICEVITKVMEGGEAAFRHRKERYGF